MTPIKQLIRCELYKAVESLGGPPELLAKLNAGEAIDQSKIYFRTVISVETAAKTLAWMSRSILVSVGERQPGEAVIHVYRLN